MQQAHDDQLRRLIVRFLVTLAKQRRLPQPVGDGSRHPLRHGVGVVEARLVTGDTQVDRLPRRQELLPAQRGGTGAQLLEVLGAELAQARQDAAGRAQV